MPWVSRAVPAGARRSDKFSYFVRLRSAAAMSGGPNGAENGSAGNSSGSGPPVAMTPSLSSALKALLAVRRDEPKASYKFWESQPVAQFTDEVRCTDIRTRLCAPGMAPEREIRRIRRRLGRVRSTSRSHRSPVLTRPPHPTSRRRARRVRSMRPRPSRTCVRNRCRCRRALCGTTAT